MDDLQNRETSAARVATLPSPDDFLAALTRRTQLHDGFMVRADAWATARAGGDPDAVVVEYPRDAAVVIALGVPCYDCFGLVYAEGQDGHHVRFGAEAGRHWAALISATCGGRQV